MNNRVSKLKLFPIDNSNSIITGQLGSFVPQKISEKPLKMIQIQPQCSFLDIILSIHNSRSSSTDMSYQLFEPDDPFLQKWCNIDRNDSALIHT